MCVVKIPAKKLKGLLVGNLPNDPREANLTNHQKLLRILCS